MPVFRRAVKNRSPGFLPFPTFYARVILPMALVGQASEIATGPPSLALPGRNPGGVRYVYADRGHRRRTGRPFHFFHDCRLYPGSFTSVENASRSTLMTLRDLNKNLRDPSKTRLEILGPSGPWGVRVSNSP